MRKTRAASTDTVRGRLGFTLLELIVVIAIAALLGALLLAATQRVRAASQKLQCQNHLRQIGLALHAYHGTDGALPPGHSFQNGQDAMPHASWCVRILPYLEEQSLWLSICDAFRREPEFLSPVHVNRGRVVTAFECPADPRPSAFETPGGVTIAFTHYLGMEGLNQYRRDGMLFSDSRIRFTDVTDGRSHTIMVGERPFSADREIGWWYAGWGQQKDGSAEMVLGSREVAVYGSVRDCTPSVSRFQPGSIDNQCDVLHFWSMHSAGANFGMADGSVRFLTYSAESLLPALASRAGGETAQLPD